MMHRGLTLGLFVFAVVLPTALPVVEAPNPPGAALPSIAPEHVSEEEPAKEAAR